MSDSRATNDAPPRPGCPGPDEHHPFYGGYVARVGEQDPFALLEAQPLELDRLLGELDDSVLPGPYAPGKWSVKEVLVHLSDAERILSVRALRIARGDPTPMPGYEEEAYAPSSRADRRPLAEILAELQAVRISTLALFRGFEPEWLLRRGTANDAPVSVRALLWIIPGHMEQHLGTLRDRYGLG